MRKERRVSFVILGCLFCLNILAWQIIWDLKEPKALEVNFFDVGQGDAIFIATPKRHQILIDGGPDSGILEKLSKEMPFWDRSIDLIILTHPESDHLVGLIEVLKKYKVENILWTGVVRDTSGYKEWIKSIPAKSAKIKIAQAGQKINWSRSNLGQYIDILYPLENLEGQEFKDSNNTSIVAKLNFGKNSFLFTGDAYKSVERKLIDRSFNFPVDIDSDVLKVGHHGSKTSSTEEFIKEVSPEIAVIQAGIDNPYGHPHLETLETLTKYGIKVLRTDKDGDIKILCSSQSLKLKLKE